VSLVPRGLLLASSASLALHLTALGVQGWGSAGSGRAAEPAAVLQTRLIAAPVVAQEVTATAEPTLAMPLDPTGQAPALPEPSLAVAEPQAPQLDPSPPRAVPASPPVPTAEALSARRAGDGLGVDRSPQPLDDISPATPAAAGLRGGTVTLRLVVSDRGVVESVEVVSSSPPGLFDEAARSAFANARFSPGLRGGVPVRSEVIYEVDFAALGRGTEASGRTY